MVDPRVVQTRKRLRDSVLRLASATPVEELQVREVCADAGISRATFYRHATSPADVLQGLMREELDQQRSDFLKDATGTGESLQAVHRRGINHLVDHVEAFADAYGLSLPRDDSALRPGLLAHLQDSTAGYVLLRQAEIALLGAADAPDLAFRIDAVTRNYAAGELGIIVAWCTSSQRNRASLEELILGLAPAWNLRLMGL